MSLKIVFVTGTNGLLGANLIKLLLKNGFKVIGLVRNIDSYKGIRDENLKLITGTIFDDFSDILLKVDYVVHLAAVTSQSILSKAYYWKINSNATKQLYQTAIKCKVKKFVFVSTANTLGFGTKHNPGNENTSIKEPFNDSIYALSKKSAEDYILKNKGENETIILNPTFMLGAYDTKPSSGKIILLVWKKKIIFYPPGGKNFVHVEDVAKGILKALDKGRSGEKYLLSNENLSYRDFFRKVSSVSGQKSILIKLPEWVLLAAGYIGDLLRGLKIETSLSSCNMRILCINNYYSNKKSIKELDLTYQPIDKAIGDAISYFNTHQSKFN